MAKGDTYRAKAAQLLAQAKTEASDNIRRNLLGLSQAYLRLADQADQLPHAQVGVGQFGHQPPTQRVGDQPDERRLSNVTGQRHDRHDTSNCFDV